MLLKKAYSLLSGLILLSVLGGCVKEVDMNAQKQQENDARIRKYITDNNLGTPAKDTLGLYVFIKEANAGGIQPKAGDSVVVHQVTYTLDGKVIDSTSVQNNQPFKYWYNVSLDNRVLAGFGLGVRYMREGEKATVLVPSSLTFGSLGDATYFDPYSPLRFDLHLVDVITEEERIEKYLTDNDLSGFETTSTGLRFRLNSFVPDSARADSGKTAYVKFTGRFLDGQQFDSNVNTDGTLSVLVKTNKVVAGFDEGLTKMRKGERATLIFPSNLGYGVNGRRNSNGQYTILPYQPLVFDIEVVDVK